MIFFFYSFFFIIILFIQVKVVSWLKLWNKIYNDKLFLLLIIGKPIHTLHIDIFQEAIVCKKKY